MATDQDYFRLELSHNADMLFWVSRAEKGMDFLGTLLDGNGNTIATHDDSFLSGDRSKHFFIRKELDPGLYYLKVSGGLAATYDVCKGYRPEDTVNWEYCEETFEKAAAETPGPYTVGAQAIETRHTGFPTSLPLTVSEGTVTAARFKNHTEKHFYTITVDQQAPVSQGGAWTQVNTIDLPGEMEFEVNASLSQVDGPEGHGVSVAVDFSGASQIFFMPDGSAVTSAGILSNGVVYVGEPLKVETNRAVTLFGSTGRIRQWIFNVDENKFKDSTWE